MACQINFENRGRGGVLDFGGAVTGAEIIEAADRMYRADRHNRLRYQIVDLTAATSLDISEEQLRQIALLDKQAASKNPNRIVALVGDETIFAGSDRRYAVYAEVWAGFEAEFFTTLNAVRDWLANRYPEFSQQEFARHRAWCEMIASHARPRPTDSNLVAGRSCDLGRPVFATGLGAPPVWKW